jgi:hypothetical protein
MVTLGALFVPSTVKVSKASNNFGVLTAITEHSLEEKLSITT